MSQNLSGPQSASATEPAALLASDARGGSGLPAPPKERADAARNRVRILAAAERLFAEHGAAEVSMDQIAAEAGVGKGTLFRRFGDKAGLVASLLGDREAGLQEAMLHGPAPLGPEGDASPQARLLAFLDTYAVFLDANLELFHLSQTAAPGSRYRVGPYWLWHKHVRFLLAAARPDFDGWYADYAAHVLLAPLSAEAHQAVRRTASLDICRAGITTLARAVIAGPAASTAG